MRLGAWICICNSLEDNCKRRWNQVRCFLVAQRRLSEELETTSPAVIRLIVAKPMLHMHSNGVQVKATPSMEPQNFSLCCSRSEKRPGFFTVWPVPPTARVETQRLDNIISVWIVQRSVIPWNAGDRFIWILKFNSVCSDSIAVTTMFNGPNRLSIPIVLNLYWSDSIISSCHKYLLDPWKYSIVPSLTSVTSPRSRPARCWFFDDSTINLWKRLPNK